MNAVHGNSPCACEPPAEGKEDFPQGPEADVALAELCRALAHPARIRILRVLAEREQCICGEIVDEIDLAQSTVSQHLKILKEAGFIRGEIQGPRSCYCLEPSRLERLEKLIGSLADADDDAFEDSTKTSSPARKDHETP